jgi:regulator of protease activity HflC (stomatin/prohibitin superfamily)
MLGFLVFLVFAGLVAVSIAWAVSPLFSQKARDARYDKEPAPGPHYAGFVLAVVFGFLAILGTGITQIEAGHVGVVRNWGAVTGEVLQPGISWRIPFVSSVDDVDTRVRSIRIENYTAASKEQQDLFVNITLNYHVDPQKAPEIVQNIGQDFEAKIVNPRFLDIPKSVTDDYPTSIVLNSRDEIREKSTALLREALAPFGFVVDNIAIENFSYSAEYNASIEQKQIAQQQVETEKQKLAQAGIVAQTRVAEAEGLANAQIERARGEAESNRLVAESLTEEILINRYIEKLAPGIQSILVPSENGFILDLGSVLAQPTPTPAP